MKAILSASVCALALLALVTTARGDGPAANGDFVFGVEGATGAIQFDARTHDDGTSQGQMHFTGQMAISNEDVDGEGTGGVALSGLTIGVTFDCLAIDENRAAMSGVITSASAADYIGLHAVLAVADNEEGIKAPALDAFTWGIYRSTARTWIASDAERDVDPGVGLVWIATDAERTDDVGVPSNLSTEIDCESFPLSAFALDALPHGAGNIQVKP